MTKVISKISELQAELVGKKIGTVFTMGALHAGHAQLMKQCRSEIGVDGLLVVTVFVNPTQFNDKDDLEKYPRDLAKDVLLCSENSVDIVFAPEVSEIYPADLQLIEIDLGELGQKLEGKSRPGHFAAVAKVVNRLIEITKPDVSCFGEKDFQQLAVVRKLVRELKLPVRIIGVETVRDVDGLAMSSRNMRLSDGQRLLAANLFKALQMTKTNLESGTSISQSVEIASDWLKQFAEIELDYLTVQSPELSQPLPGSARILVAARIGDVRLIDNIPCHLEAVNV